MFSGLVFAIPKLSCVDLEKREAAWNIYYILFAGPVLFSRLTRDAAFIILVK